MTVWEGLVGQHSAVDLLRRIADERVGARSEEGAAQTRLAQAWLMTGPAGSGRSNVARAFAAALLCPTGGCGACSSCRMALLGSHPDLRVLRADKVIIGIDEVRELVAASYMSPSAGPLRVQIIEDADRMPERTSNVLLKAIEEPPETTVWILCAPSEADMLPTIRSRVHTVRLVTPSLDDVATYLETTEGVDPARAEACARLAQSHVGMARRLAVDESARVRRETSIRILLGILSAGFVAKGAADVLALAQEDAQSSAQHDADAEKAELMRQLGLPPGEPVPAQYRAQLRAFEEDAKKRDKRSLLDGIDRILTDYESVVRDALLTCLGAGQALINSEHAREIQSWVSTRKPAEIVALMDAIAEARKRIRGNVPPLLAVEALLTVAVDGKGANA